MKTSIDYSQAFYEMFFDSKMEAELIGSLIENIDSKRTLEIGCGPGRLLHMYSSFPKHQFDLIDLDPEMTKRATVESRRLGAENIRVHTASGLSLPFSDATFDVVLIPMIGIEEMAPLFGVLSEAMRVLKPGGKLYFSAENPLHLRSGGLGIFRFSKAISGGTASLELTRNPSKGPYLHDLALEIRKPGLIQKKIFEQGTLPALEFTRLLSGLGFSEIKISAFGDSAVFDEQSMNLMSVRALKPESRRTFAAENSATAYEFFNNVASVYESATQEERYPAGAWLRDKLAVYRNMHPIILDLGVGAGIAGDLASQVGCIPASMYGIEISPAMRETAIAKGKYDAIWLADLNATLPIERYHIFDLIIAVGVFEFIHDENLAIKWIRDLLRFGGRALFTFDLSASESFTKTVSHPEGRFLVRSRKKEEILHLFDLAELKVVDYSEGPGYKLIRDSQKQYTTYAYVEVMREDKYE